MKLTISILFVLCCALTVKSQTVLSGNQLASLQGRNPASLVAFKWTGQWIQVPLQVDEKDFRSLATLRGDAYLPSVVYLVYTDTQFVTGADSDTSFDANDELVFDEVGGQIPVGTSYPAGTIAGTGQEVVVGSDYVYLFVSDGSLNQGAGVQRVTKSGASNEISVYTTTLYQRSYHGRWSTGELRFIATNIDVLDEEKAQYAPGECKRSYATFDSGTGAYIANRCGALRCIRSAFGANSGDYTQYTRLFYRDREDFTVFLRVHPLPAFMLFNDLSPAAQGMVYSNNNSPAGVVVDGVQDAISGTRPYAQWQHWTGTQGALSIAARITSNIQNLQTQQWYLDRSSNAGKQCTGDSVAYGNSGLWMDAALPNTDPRSTPFSTLTLRQVLLVSPDNTSNTAASSLSNAIDNPPTVVVNSI